jgi:hypothetical protein
VKRLTVLFAVLVAALSITAVATANNGNGAATAFKATYVYNGVTFTCSGAHVVNKTGTFDSETCDLSGDEGLYSLGTTTFGPGAWFSDFSGPGWPYQTVADTTFTVTKTANLDGTFTLSIIAYY